MTMSVLVVDDQPVNRAVMGALLRSLNLHVIEACNGQEGVRAYLQAGASIACIFLDLMMPVVDGFKAALSIRSAENRHGWLPVPIVAYTSEDVRHGTPTYIRCMESGFDDVIPKPMNKLHAMQLLARWVPSLQPSSASSGGTNADGATSDGDTAACSCGSDQERRPVAPQLKPGQRGGGGGACGLPGGASRNGRHA